MGGSRGSLPTLLLSLVLLVGSSGSSAERDYYEVLGVARDASDADIKRAYRALSLQVRACAMSRTTAPAPARK